MDTKDFERARYRGQLSESNTRLLFVFLIFDLFELNENTSEEIESILNAQISQATGVKLGNYIQSIDDALTLVPDEWRWEPIWQEMLQQLREPHPDHPDKMGAFAYRQTPEGDHREVMFPLPIAVSIKALEVHRSMSRRRENGLPLVIEGVDCVVKQASLEPEQITTSAARQ